MLFRDRVGTEPYVVGQMPIKGEKKKRKKPAHQIFRKFAFILCLKELCLLELNGIYL